MDSRSWHFNRFSIRKLVKLPERQQLRFSFITYAAELHLILGVVLPTVRSNQCITKSANRTYQKQDKSLLICF